MGEIIMRNWDSREFCVRVNWPSPIRQVWLPIWCEITLVQGVLNPIRQVVPIISDILLYPPHRSHLHPPSRSFSSITLPLSPNPKSSHSFLSLHVMIMSWQWIQHTLSTVYTKHRIHRVQHTLSTASTQDRLSSLHSHDYELTPECSFNFQRASLHDRPPSARTAQRLSYIATFPWLPVN